MLIACRVWLTRPVDLPVDQAWRRAGAYYVHATPAVVGGIAYFGGCDEIFHGVRVSDGREVVKLPAGADTAASAVIAGGLAYFGTFDNEVVAIDLAARRTKWRYKDDTRQFPFYSSAAFANGTTSGRRTASPTAREIN